MLPKLYGMSKNGKIKEWSVWTEGDTVVMEHGYLGGKKQLSKVVATPKNVGKKNVTSAEEQALSEAKSRWQSQIDSCYCESIDQLEEVDKKLPMLAKDYTKTGHQITYPCFGQPKLDGVRAIADTDKTTVTMTSRGGKSYNVPSHIYHSLKRLYNYTGISKLDGEIYCHGMSLQKIVSAIKVESDLTMNLSYHIFDVPSDFIFGERLKFLELLKSTIERFNIPFLKVVETPVIESEEQARSFLSFYEEDGYEGLMLRNIDGIYEYNHRSSDLQKWKNMQDIEAYIYDVEKDLIGQGVLKCRLPNNVEFKCKMKGNATYRDFENQKYLKGEWVTVKFQQYTEDGVPQFPVGINIRNCTEEGVPLE